MKVSNANHDEALDLSESMKDVTNNTNNSLNNTINKSLSKSQTVNNRHFDEELDLSRHSDESIDSTNLRPRNNAGLKLGNLSPTAGQKKHSNFSPTRKSDSKPMVAAGAGKPSASREHDEDESSEEGEDEEEDGKEDASYDVIDGQYNPEDYANLNVSSEVKDLFQYITRFKPQDVDVDTALKCFVPDYIPAIGEMDPFLKVLKNSTCLFGISIFCLCRFLVQMGSQIISGFILSTSRRPLSLTPQFSSSNCAR